MNKFIIFLFVLLLGSAHAVSSTVPESVRADYFGAIGVTAGYDGIGRIYSSLNSLWAAHQWELQALKNWEETALKPAVNQ